MSLGGIHERVEKEQPIATPSLPTHTQRGKYLNAENKKIRSLE